jgi:hypothetical protein
MAVCTKEVRVAADKLSSGVYPIPWDSDIQKPTLGYRSTSVRLFLCWRSTKAQLEEKQFIFTYYAYYAYCFTYFADLHISITIL